MSSLVSRARVAFILISLAAMPPAATPAQQQKKATADDDEVIRISSDLVVLDALVLNKRTGQSIGGLKTEDFELYDDGVKQQISYFGRDELPLSIMLLLDTSGSVRPIIEQVGDGALNALQQLKPEDEVAVMAFADHAMLVQGFTRDRPRIADKIKEASTAVELGRSTLLSEALYAAARHMPEATNPSSRRVIIVVTDNIAPPADDGTDREIYSELSESGSVVYGLIVRAGIGKVMNVMTLGLLRAVNSYAEQTGGEVIGASKKEVAEKLGSIIARLRARYNLGYKPVNTSDEGKFRRIKLQLSPTAAAAAAGRKEKPVVRTRQGYYFRRRVAPL